MFADDDVNVSTLVSKLLDPHYEVVGIATGGKDALHRILELAPDFAVLDISMPEIDGFAVARQLQKAHCPTKLVFLTLIEDVDYVSVAKTIGHGYVLKKRVVVDLPAALMAAGDGNFFSSL